MAVLCPKGSERPGTLESPRKSTAQCQGLPPGGSAVCAFTQGAGSQGHVAQPAGLSERSLPVSRVHCGQPGHPCRPLGVLTELMM